MKDNFSIEIRHQNNSIYKNFVCGDFIGITSFPKFHIKDTFRATEEEFINLTNQELENFLFELLEGEEDV